MTQEIQDRAASQRAVAEVQRDLLALPGVGASILEISHRSKTFENIIAQAETNLRQLLQIPDNYAVLMLQGGAEEYALSAPWMAIFPGLAITLGVFDGVHLGHQAILAANVARARELDAVPTQHFPEPLAQRRRLPGQPGRAARSALAASTLAPTRPRSSSGQAVSVARISRVFED